MNGKSITDERVDDINGKVEIFAKNFDILSTLHHHLLGAAQIEILTLNNIKEPRVEYYVVCSFENF